MDFKIISVPFQQSGFETEIKFLRTSSTYKHSSKTRVLLEDNSKQNVPMAVTATVAPVPIFKITSPSFSLRVSLNPCNILQMCEVVAESTHQLLKRPFSRFVSMIRILDIPSEGLSFFREAK